MIEAVAVQVVDVLLVEDDSGDVLLAQEAFERSAISSRLSSRLHVARDGEQAIGFLRRTGPYASAPRPGLILLDLNLPRRGGLEVLAELKADENLKSIPVVVLTTSAAQDDILRSYQLHASAYVTKPTGFDLFIDAIRKVNNFYLASPGCPTETRHGPMIIRRAGRLSSERTLVMRDR
jgi:CheY-like chemotaxis protein